jgi:serine/threonine-protein kinase RsbW
MTTSLRSFLIESETAFMSQTDQRLATDLLIPSDTVEARRVQEQIEHLLKVNQFGERDIFGIRLAVEEALVNAIKHGNQMDSARKVRVAFQVSQEKFEVIIADEGEGFDPVDVPDPTAPENLERPCGRGIMLMRHYMTSVAFNDRGNAVSMTKLRNGAK